ncbi:hypothetical protein FRB90_008477 [Tulasnella sp. 427]|nr:hypothetical protein FRB90_008477 [Tulasnella sp. 427]
MASLQVTEPLHLFSIPSEVLDNLALRPSPLAQTQATQAPVEEEPPVGQSVPGTASCNLCPGTNLGDVQEQRAHFRSDWHRYNVKLRLQSPGATPVTEAQFTNLVDGLEESISGSESSESNETDPSEDKVAALLHRTRLKGKSRSVSPEGRNIPKSPILWFTSTDIPDTQLGVYATIFSTQSSPEAYVEELREMQDGGEDGRQWAVFMTAGGHFAGAVIRVSKSVSEKEAEEAEAAAAASAPVAPKKKSKASKAPQKPAFFLEVIRHKTFHRYTTRRKQGGSQSVNDNAKGPAKSAGALLRRYGEQALKDDIRGLLAEWREDIEASERIFIRANTANMRIFLDFEDSPVRKNDERLRTFPFPTRRPTQSEVVRCVTEVLRVKVSHLTEEALAAQDQALLDSLPKPKPAPAPSTKPPPPEPKVAPVKLTQEEERTRDLWNRMLDMVRKGRLEPLKTFWEKQGRDFVGGVDGRLPNWLDPKDGANATLLQVATASAQPEVVRWLLEDLRADPTIPVPPQLIKYKDGEADDDQTAYDLAPNLEVRNVFGRCAYAHLDWWDWQGKGRVRTILTPEVEAKQKREEAKRAKMRERAKEREAAARPAAVEESEQPKEEKVVKPVDQKPKTGPQRLGGSGTGAAAEMQSVTGLTPEMRARIERERRARAAEARMKALGAG